MMKFSTKRLQIDKARSNMLIVVTISTVVAVFSLVATKSLISQASYQRKVLHERRIVIKQLKDNLAAADSLVSEYKIFNSPSTNLIGGKSTTDANASPPDGDNTRIVLDALPSSYDFPALISSVTKILSGQNITTPSIGAADQTATIETAPSANPQPQTITLTVGGTSDFADIQRLITDFERSIRPFDVQTVSIQGSAVSMNVTLTMNTYFQPAKSVTIGTKEVK